MIKTVCLATDREKFFTTTCIFVKAMSKSKVAYNPSVLNKLEGRNLNGSVQPQNVNRNSRVYVFAGNNGTASQLCVDDDDDDDVDEVLFENKMVNVRPRKGKNGATSQDKTSSTKNTTKKVKIIDRQVFPNDTLSKFALQYGCTVAELKTTNNLYNDQDFHALKHIKIPIQPHSLLTERAEEENRRRDVFKQQEDNEDRSNQDENSDSDYENTEGQSSVQRNIRTVSISLSLKEPVKFLKKMDEDLQKICQSVSFQNSDPNDTNKRLTTQCIHPRAAKKKDADELGTIWAGFGWKSAVIAFVLVAIVVPILYIIYYIEKIKS